MIRSGFNDPSQYKCWKLFRATLNSIVLLEKIIIHDSKNLDWRVLSDSPLCIFLTVMVQPIVTGTGLQSLRAILMHIIASTEKCTSKINCLIFLIIIMVGSKSR